MELGKCMHGNGPECERCKAIDIPEVEEMEATITDLRAEVERLRGELAEEQSAAANLGTLWATACGKLTDSQSTVAGLRRALEEVQEGLHAHCNEHDEECCRICLGEEITAALAASPDDHERRIKSEALKQAAEEVYNRLNAKGAHSGARRQGWEAGLVDFADYLKAEADRLEAENGR